LIGGPTLNQLIDQLAEASAGGEARLGEGPSRGSGRQEHANGPATDEGAMVAAGHGPDRTPRGVGGTNGDGPSYPGANGVGGQEIPALRPAGGAAVSAPRKWLIAPRPNPRAKVRLFCFPFAGGGVVSFRSWPQLLGDSVEVVAVEAPGRGTRMNEAPI